MSSDGGQILAFWGGKYSPCIGASCQSSLRRGPESAGAVYSPSRTDALAAVAAGQVVAVAPGPLVAVTPEPPVAVAAGQAVAIAPRPLVAVAAGPALTIEPGLPVASPIAAGETQRRRLTRSSLTTHATEFCKIIQGYFD
jgi:hypothetical protein